MAAEKDTREKEEKRSVKRDGNDPGAEQQKAGTHPWEKLLDDYPLRAPEEDAGWVVKIIKAWLWIAVLSGAFILALIILGFFYD